MSKEESNPFFFFSADIEFIPEEPETLKQWLIDLLEAEDERASNIEYVFCSDDYLLDINRTYLNHDYFTDIITFPLDDNPIEASIYISIDRVRENANSLDIKFSEELHRVMAHGLLHLCGYADKTEEEQKRMRTLENTYLKRRPDLLKADIV